MSLFCSQCETINVDYASFCKNCGTKLNKEQNNSTNDNLSESERYFYSGNSHYDLKDYASSIRDYAKAIELNPNLADAYYNRGNVYYHLKDYASAIRDYTKDIELNPNLEAHKKRELASKKLKNSNTIVKEDLNSNNTNVDKSNIVLAFIMFIFLVLSRMAERIMSK
jgi:tetratricopeptide (TPR) repeat protein